MEDFLERLGAPTPGPAAGAAGAAAAALAAALAEMGMGLARRRGRATDEDVLVFRHLRQAFWALAARDEEAYSFVLRARRQAREADHGALGEALAAAARVPLEGLWRLLDLLTALQACGSKCPKAAAVDYAAAFPLADAAAAIFGACVRENVAGARAADELSAELRRVEERLGEARRVARPPF